MTGECKILSGRRGREKKEGRKEERKAGGKERRKEERENKPNTLHTNSIVLQPIRYMRATSPKSFASPEAKVGIQPNPNGIGGFFLSFFTPFLFLPLAPYSTTPKQPHK